MRDPDLRNVVETDLSFRALSVFDDYKILLLSHYILRYTVAQALVQNITKTQEAIRLSCSNIKYDASGTGTFGVET
jgi:hypothetical protein